MSSACASGSSSCPPPRTRSIATASIVAHNPLGKIPTLIPDEGAALYDSRVICEYLNALAKGDLIPQPGPARWNVLAEQSLADGIMDAAVLGCYYRRCLARSRCAGTIAEPGQLEKVASGLGEIERRAAVFGDRVDPRHDHCRLCVGLPRFPLRVARVAREAS